MLFGKKYLDFIDHFQIRNRHPEPQNLYQGDFGKLIERYEHTLFRYEKYFGTEAPEEYWESKSERFGIPRDSGEGIGDNSDQATSVTNFSVDNGLQIYINLFKFCYTSYIQHKKPESFSKPVFSHKLTDEEGVNILKVRKDREQAVKEERKDLKLFSWRKRYPHCSNVYSKHSIEEMDPAQTIHLPPRTEEKAGAIFADGGFLFLSEWYDKHPLYSNVIDRTQSKVIKYIDPENPDLDDIADLV